MLPRDWGVAEKQEGNCQKKKSLLKKCSPLEGVLPGARNTLVQGKGNLEPEIRATCC